MKRHTLFLKGLKFAIMNLNLNRIVMTMILMYPFIFASSNSLLLLGDSVDRGIVHAWCKKHGEGNPIGLKNETWAISRDWGDGSILYKPQRWIRNTPTHMCENSLGDRIATAHLLGSASRQPYFHTIQISPNDSYSDTEARVARAIELYKKEFGYPDRIIIHTTQWDIQYMYENLTWEYIYGNFSSNPRNWEHLLDRFYRNTNERLDQVYELLKDSTVKVDVGLRTAAWEERGGLFLHGMNDAIRKISQIRNVTLYDLDYDIWSITSFNYEYYMEKYLFRDWIHPKDELLAIVGDKLLGRRYSSYLHFKDMKGSWKHFHSSGLHRYGSTDSHSTEKEKGTTTARDRKNSTFFRCSDAHFSSIFNMQSHKKLTEFLLTSLPGIIRCSQSMQIVLLRGYSIKGEFQTLELNYSPDQRDNSSSTEEAVGGIIESFLQATNTSTQPQTSGLLPTRHFPVSSLVHPEYEHDKYRMTSLHYAAVINGTLFRYANVTTDFMFEHFLGPGDILYMPKDLLFQIPSDGVFPMDIFIPQKKIAVVLNNGSSYVKGCVFDSMGILNGLFHLHSDVNISDILSGIPVDSIYLNVQEHWLQHFIVKFESKIIDMCRNGRLIRFHDSRLVYLIRDMKRIEMSRNLFVKYGFDFDDVIAVKEKSCFENMPIVSDENQ